MQILPQSLATLSLLLAPEQKGWQSMPSIPDPIGFAGMAAGAPGEVLIAAGGARFPGKPPWEGGAKEYADSIWRLENPSSGWTRAKQKLPQTLAYAVSGTWKDTLIVAGGETRPDLNSPISCVDKVFNIRTSGNQLHLSALPPLPSPIAYAAGTIVGSKLVVVGGISSPSATKALDTLWILDLANPESGWSKGPSIPGPARMLPVCAATASSFFLMGGAELHPDPQGKPVRKYLRDAWRLNLRGGWQRLPDMPWPVAAAATPAPVSKNLIWILSGDDGSQAGSPPLTHKGFPARSLAFDLEKNRWLEGPPVVASRVTLPAVAFRNRWWLISGETKPGIRSPEVWSADASTWAGQ